MDTDNGNHEGPESSSHNEPVPSGFAPIEVSFGSRPEPFSHSDRRSRFERTREVIHEATRVLPPTTRQQKATSARNERHESYDDAISFGVDSGPPALTSYRDGHYDHGGHRGLTRRHGHKSDPYDDHQRDDALQGVPSRSPASGSRARRGGQASGNPQRSSRLGTMHTSYSHSGATNVHARQSGQDSGSDVISDPTQSTLRAHKTANIKALIEHLDEDMDGFATKNDCGWVQDLREVGYSSAEIAQLLYEREHDSPWIFFDRQHEGDTETSVDVLRHIAGCCHNLPSQASAAGRFVEPLHDLQHTLEELSGLAGLSPDTRDTNDWPGVAQFAGGSVQIRYRSEAEWNRERRAKSQYIIVGRIVAAIAMLQQQGLCCNSLTVLCLSSPTSNDQSTINSTNHQTTPPMDIRAKARWS